MDLNQRIEQWLDKAQQEFHGAVSDPHSRRPYVTLSYAQSWDGSITTSPGETLELSSAAAMRVTHQLRSLHDGILVGIGTVLADDPRLTVRQWSGSDPQPIVLDSQLRLPPSSRLCQSDSQRCWVLTTCTGAEARSNCDLIEVPGDDAGQVDLQAALAALYDRGIRSLMVEGGASIISAFLRARLADVIVLTVAPLLVGGYNAIGRLCDAGSGSFPRISPLFSQQLDDELIVWGRLRYGNDGRGAGHP
ncbi:MAG: RibD family protein [Gammaproteobacteria bacterium]